MSKSTASGVVLASLVILVIGIALVQGIPNSIKTFIDGKVQS